MYRHKRVQYALYSDILAIYQLIRPWIAPQIASFPVLEAVFSKLYLEPAFLRVWTDRPMHQGENTDEREENMAREQKMGFEMGERVNE